MQRPSTTREVMSHSSCSARVYCGFCTRIDHAVLRSVAVDRESERKKCVAIPALVSDALLLPDDPRPPAALEAAA